MGPQTRKATAQRAIWARCIAAVISMISAMMVRSFQNTSPV
jgi:hypothetical protein